jgi:hypothetical protein
VLGSYFTPDYFDCVADAAVREPLQQIAREINQDLDYFAQILEKHGAQVLRPPLPSQEQFVQHWKHTGQFPTPPLQPRNYHAVIGHDVYQLDRATEADLINAILPAPAVDLVAQNQEFFQTESARHRDCYNSTTDTWYRKQKYQELAGPDWPTFDQYVQGDRSGITAIQQELASFETALQYETKEFGCLQAPNIFPVNGTLYVDAPEYFDYQQWAQHHVNFSGRVIQINSGAGHTDGCFVVVGQQVIIGVVPGIDYAQTFPGHRVVASASSYAAAVARRADVSGYLNRSWWVPGEENNQQLINYVDQYMQDWTGTAYETSFDLNVLALDEKTVCMIVCDPEIVKQLNSFGIHVIEIPWRHRFFVDCGLHCLTLDLYRENDKTVADF